MPDRRRRKSGLGGLRSASSVASANRDPSFAKAELGSFLKPRLAMTNRAHIPGESDFAKDHGIGGGGGVGHRGRQRGGPPAIRGAVGAEARRRGAGGGMPYDPRQRPSSRGGHP